MPADRPYGVLFAFSTASSGVRNVSTDSTGPKISSLGDPVALGDVREQRRPEEVAALGQVAGRLVQLGALGHAGRDELGDLLELGLRVDRPDVGVLVERVADPDRRQAVLELLDERLDDRLLDQQPRPGAADLALVEVDAVDDALDGLVERRVVEHDVGGLAAELEGERLVGPGDALGDLLADLGRAGERDLVDARVA